MKKKYFFIGILLIIFISCSTVHAESNDTDIYQNAPQIQNFQTLNEEIQNTSVNGVLVLQNNYTLNENTQGEEILFKEGINLNKKITIEGNNHTIDAKNLVRIFNVNSKVVIKNVILVNGYHTGSLNGAGAINVNTGSLYLENSILLNNYAYSTTTTKGTALSDGGGAICTSSNTYTSISNCTFINNTICASCNVGGGAIMFKSGSSFNVKDSFFINNRAIGGGSTYGGAIAERGISQGEIKSSSFVNNSAGIGKSISVNKAPITGNEFINSGVDYDFSSSGSCTYNTFINGGVSYSNIAACSAVVKNNWYGYNPSSKNSDVVADLINNNGTIYVSLTKDGYGNNLSNPEYLYPRNVEFGDNVKYKNLTTTDAIAINEITETLEEGYIYHVNVRVDRQILDLYFKYVKQNDFNSTVPRYSENYSDYIFNGEFRIKSKNKVYNSFYEAVNDALSMDDDITIYVGEGTYTKKWSDTYYNYDYMNYDFNITSNDKVITVIGAGNDKTIFKGETFGFGINGNSTFRFVNITFQDFKDSVFVFNTTNTSIYFTNCKFKSISTKYVIYLSGENTTMYIDGCYLYGVSTYPFWNNADSSYIVIDSSIFDRVNYNYAISEIHTENDFSKHIATIYHNFNDYYIFNHNFLLNKVEAGFDCTPNIYLSNSSIGLGDSVDIIADFNYFTNSTGTYRFDSNFIDDFTVTFTTPKGTKSVNLKNSVACLKYSPTEAGTQTITVIYGDKSTQLTLNIIDRQMPSFNVEGRENIVATLPEDAEGQITFNVNGAETIKDVNNGIANIDLTPLEDIKYVVEVSYSGDSKYMPASETVIFSPMRNITYLDIKCNETTIYSDTIIEVHTNVNGNIKLIIDEIEYNNLTENNVATFVIKDLIRGIHNITAIFEGDSNYLQEKNTSTINIIKNTPTLTSYVKTVLSGEDVIMNITLDDDISSDVYIFMNGKVYKTNVVNGTGYLNFTRLHGGDYTYRLYYNGNDKYYPAENNKGFTVIKLKEIHVDAINGDDENMGTSPSDAMKTIACALECIRYNGTIYLDKGTFSGVNNTKLTITQPVTITGIDNAIIDGELKNYFFKVNGGVNFTLKNVNFKNVCSNAVENPQGSNLTVEDSCFEGGPGSAIKNYGNLYINNSTFSSLSSSTRGVAVSNYGNAIIANSTFKNSLAKGIGSTYQGSTIFGVVYNEGEMTIERCVFDNNTPKNRDTAIGSYNIYNYGNLKANHNIFINSNYEKYVISLNKVLSTYIFNSENANVTLNYYDANKHIEKYINFDIDKYFIMDFEQNYFPLNIGDKANITLTLKLDNGTFYKNYNLLPDIYINFNVNGKPIIKKLVDGKATVEFNESDVKGSYNVTATLGDCTKLAEIDVGKVNSSMEVEYEEIYYSEVAQFNMTVTGNYTHQPNGSITLRLDDDIYTTKIGDTKATIEVPDLIPGTYDLEIRYEGDEDYNKAIFHTNYTVDKRPLNISLSIAEVYYGQNGQIIVNINPGEYSNQAYLYIKDMNNTLIQKKTVYVRDGTKLPLKNFAAGEYNITIELWNTKYYQVTNASAIFKVKKYETNLTINTTDIMAGETAYLNVTLTPKGEVAGNSNIIINNETRAIFLKNGENTITLDNLAGGIYNITIFFPGDKKYANSTATVILHANKYQTRLNVTVDDEKITVKVDPDNATGTVNLYINDQLQSLNLTNGQVTFIPNYNKVNNSIFIYYEGNYLYNYSTFNTTYENKDLINLTGYDVLTYDGEEGTIYVTLTDESGYGIAERNITITINNEKYIKTTDNSGTASLTLTLPIGNYTITSQFEEKIVTNTFTVLKNINLTSVGDLEVYDNETFQYYVKLTDGRNNNIKDAEITFEINGQTYTNKTNENGIARIFLTLNQGNYTITVSYKTESVTNKINVRENDNYTLTAGDLEMYYRDGSSFNVTLKDGNGNPLSGRIITFAINNITYPRTTNNNGVASLLINLGSGKYTIKTTYIDTSISNIITVKDYPPVITGKDIEMYYKDGSNYTVTLKDTRGTPLANKEITFNIDGENYTRFTDKDGIASITINLPAGTYTVTATYKNISTTNKIVVKDYPPVITGKDIEMYYKDGTNYTVTLKNTKGTPITNVDVTFTIDGETYTKPTNNKGIASITINLPEGTYTIKATYKNVSTTNTITVKDYEPVITGKDIEMYYRDGSNYIITLKNTKGTPITNVDVTFAIDGETYIRPTDKNGIAKITINLPEGTYTVTATYKNATTTNKIVVKDYPPVISGKDIEMYYHDGTNYTITLKNTKGTPITNAEVTFTINGENYKRLTNKEGIASITINLPEGTYTIKATYKNATTTNKIVVKDYTPVITGEDIEMYYKDGTNYTITLKNTKGTPISNVDVTFTINGETYIRPTDKNGIAKITINLPEGTYTAKATYKNTSTTNKITVKDYEPIITGKDIEMYYRDGTNYTITLKNTKGTPITNVDITFNINNRNYARITDGNGIARITINLPAGTYTIKTTYKNTSTTNKITVKDYTPVITGKDITMYYRDGSNYTITLKNTKGTALANKIVTFHINNRDYNRTTNSNGEASLTINLPEGTYTIKASYTNVSVTNKITVKEYSPIITGKDIEMYYRDGTNYTITLKNSKGDILSDKIVTFNIDGKDYNRTTNSNGEASLTINLPAGTYTIKATYKNATATNKITVKDYPAVLVADDLEMYFHDNSTFKATLKNTKGELLTNRKVTFSINNETYTGTTNNQGTASLIINLAPGTYTIKTTYKNITITNKITIKTNYNLKANDLEMYYKDGSRFTAKLTDKNGNVLTKVNVTFTINGNRYNRLTNSEGIASIAINLNSGNHTITSRYQEEEIT
ncbi:Ig-like domain-containing protein, partial [Methanobrevibacter sp.]|uniref:Ig-like domain-containing protein n=1 Tax=Methanobrevibacter sp. TaxID=66852 RepID=UPI00388D086C